MYVYVFGVSAKNLEDSFAIYSQGHCCSGSQGHDGGCNERKHSGGLAGLELSQEITRLEFSRGGLGDTVKSALSVLDLTVSELSCDSSSSVGVELETLGKHRDNNSGIGSFMAAGSDTSELNIDGEHNC